MADLMSYLGGNPNQKLIKVNSNTVVQAKPKVRVAPTYTPSIMQSLTSKPVAKTASVPAKVLPKQPETIVTVPPIAPKQPVVVSAPIKKVNKVKAPVQAKTEAVAVVPKETVAAVPQAVVAVPVQDSLHTDAVTEQAAGRWVKAPTREESLAAMYANPDSVSYMSGTVNPELSDFDREVARLQAKQGLASSVAR